MKTMSSLIPDRLAPVPHSELLALLNQRLTDVLGLWLQAKQAHWNVRGPGFFALHGQFDRVAAELAGLADEIAERIAQLDGVAVAGGPPVVAPSFVGIAGGERHLRALAESLRHFGFAAHEALVVAEGAGDPVTVDLLTDTLATVAKLRWLLEAHFDASHERPVVAPA
jgi:starvation-inducible DNA-binding protein